jgi:MFS transporter, PPP family, 3-phenylpropionic acid transporter
LQLWLVLFAGLYQPSPSDLTALVLIQPLHGITFALLHLACMQTLATSVPPGLAATAQALYSTVGIGLASALLTISSGWLYSRLGGQAFLAMSMLCVAALPVALSLLSVSKPTAQDAFGRTKSSRTIQ